MKIQKQLSKKRGDKIYHKYVIVLPEKVIKDAGLKEGQELEAKSSKNKIILEKK